VVFLRKGGVETGEMSRRLKDHKRGNVLTLKKTLVRKNRSKLKWRNDEGIHKKPGLEKTKDAKGAAQTVQQVQ